MFWDMWAGPLQFGTVGEWIGSIGTVLTLGTTAALVIGDRRRTATRERLEQARLVYVTVKVKRHEMADPAEHDGDSVARIFVVVQVVNASLLPVGDVTVRLMLNRSLLTPGAESGGVHLSHFHWIGPNATSPEESPFSMMMAAESSSLAVLKYWETFSGAEVTFTDAAGLRWRRGADQSLAEVKPPSRWRRAKAAPSDPSSPRSDPEPPASRR